MNVCVFCSANDLDKKYVEPVKQMATLLGKAGHTLLWGGSDCGLMKIIADGVQQGGRTVGVTIELFKSLARKDTNEMIIVKTLSERKEILLERSDVIVVLPGGLGTLNEITEAMEQKRHHTHSSNIIILNIDGFYDGLKLQLERMETEDFLPQGSNTAAWVRFVNTPDQVMNVINHP
jgi:uncharacterized protein (TIGR00730 family)